MRDLLPLPFPACALSEPRPLAFPLPPPPIQLLDIQVPEHGWHSQTDANYFITSKGLSIFQILIPSVFRARGVAKENMFPHR